MPPAPTHAAVATNSRTASSSTDTADSDLYDSARSFGDDERELGGRDEGDEELSSSHGAPSNAPPAYGGNGDDDDTTTRRDSSPSTDAPETPFNPAIFGRILHSPNSPDGAQALVVNRNPFLQLASVMSSVPLAVSRAGSSTVAAPRPLTAAPISGPHHMAEIRQPANFPTTISTQALVALANPVAVPRPLPPAPSVPVPPKSKSKRPKFLGKSKAEIEHEERVAMEAAVRMQRFREQCLAVEEQNQKTMAAERVRQQMRDVIERWIDDVLRNMRARNLLQMRDSEKFAELLGDLLRLDWHFEGSGRRAESFITSQARAIRDKVREAIRLLVEGNGWFSNTHVPGPARMLILDFLCELYWLKDSLPTRQLILGQVLYFAGQSFSSPDHDRTIYTRVMPLICHAIMVQPAYLLPPNAELDAKAITPRLLKFGNVLTRWDYAVDMVIQNCGHDMLDICLKKCMELPFARDSSHEMHAHFQLAICTAFAPIVAKDPLLKTNLMLGSVSYFTYALAVFGDGMWDNDPWKPVLQLNFLYKNIVNAIVEVLDDLTTRYSFDQHRVHLSNIHRVLSHAPFREFAVKKRELCEKLYDVIDRHESNTKLSEAESPYLHAWYFLLKSLEWVGKEKLDLVMEMWFEKAHSLEILRPPPPPPPPPETSAEPAVSSWNPLLWLFSGLTATTTDPEPSESDSNHDSPLDDVDADSPPPFSYPLFCWAIVTTVNALQYQHDTTLVAYLTRYDVVPRLYRSWLANNDPSFQVAYTAALVHCCRCRWAFEELVKLKFDGMIEEGLRSAMDRLIPSPDSINSTFWLWSNPQYFAWQLQTDKESLWVLVDAVSKSSRTHRERLRDIIGGARRTLEGLQPPDMSIFMVKVLYHLFKEYDGFVDLCVL